MRRPQISLRNALIATGWFAAWCGAVAYFAPKRPLSEVEACAIAFLIPALPAAFVGALTEQPWQGIVFGAASGLGTLLFLAFGG